MLVLLLTGCQLSPPQHTMIEWADFVKFNDITYYADGFNYDNSLSFSDLGPQYALVNFRVEGNIHNPGYSSKNGDSAFHDSGTPVYTVNGYAPDFRLAVCEEGRIKIFEAFQNPTAVKGSDLLDLKNKVDYISINSDTDGQTVLAEITDALIVEEMVEMTLEADLIDGSEVGGVRYFIAFHLQDGTVVNRSYWIGSNLMAPNILLSEDFADLVRKALAD